VTTRPLKIALTADPELPVPPKLYGGIERVVDMLARALVERGHEVTLFAHKDSDSAGHLVPWPGQSSLSRSDLLRNMATLSREVLLRRFDLIHSFSRVAYLTPLLPLPVPKLMTYQRGISPRSVTWGHRLSRGTLWFGAISQWMMQHVADCGTWRVVFNGVPLSAFGFNPDPGSEAPLVFLGRVEEIKGPHLAIEIAQRTGRRLIIAGNVPPEHQAWFQREVLPHVDNLHIRYIGPVDDAQKNVLLQSAAAFLMPILWEEPFGIVMAEAMACGTPVLGLARGAVPEVVEHQATGFVEQDVDGLVAAVGRVGTLDRAACRERVKRLFSETAVAEGYLAVYEEMLAVRPRR
jgi:glycosyltransferase involved in cell wall biosynthesis